MRWIPMCAATLLVAVAPACKRQQAQPAATEVTSVTGAPGVAAMSSDDKKFMTKAAQDSMLEVARGQEVARRATNPDVKAFGNRMATHYGKAHEELKQLAAKKGLSLPTELDEKRREDLTEIKKLSGTELDKEYAEEMVDEHEDEVGEFRDASKEVNDPELRAWAAKTLPMLENHLAQARGIVTKLESESK